MFRRTFAEIHLNHLISNYEKILRIAGTDRFICPMVKANGYGHGDIQIAQTLEKYGAKNFGVCLIEEGLLLRSNGIQADILVFRGFDKYGAQKIVDHQMTPVVSTWEHIEALENSVDEFIQVHLKFNTGMNRLGFEVSESEKLYKYFKNSKKLKLKALLTHLYNGEDAVLENGRSAHQVELMEQVCDFFKPMDLVTHVLNSGGIASLNQVSHQKNHYLHHKKWGFRPGLMLYGYSPSNQFSDLDLKPVMTLKSVVNNIRRVPKGESVSYGGHWMAARDSWIAVVPIGYADGVHRLISNKVKILFAGQKAEVIGRICMDFLMLDVTDIISDQNPEKFHMEEVIIFGFDEQGNHLSAEDIAQAAQTISWEVLTSVGERVPRLFKGGDL